MYATSEGTRVAASEKAVDKLIGDVEKGTKPRVGATILERLELEKIPLDRFEIKNIYKGEEANKIWARTGYTEPPYVKRMIVLDMKLTKETKFVRVYIDPEKAGGNL